MEKIILVDRNKGKNKVITEAIKNDDDTYTSIKTYYQVKDFLGCRHFPVLAIVENTLVDRENFNDFTTGGNLGAIYNNNTTYIYDSSIDLLNKTGLNKKGASK